MYLVNTCVSFDIINGMKSTQALRQQELNLQKDRRRTTILEAGWQLSLQKGLAALDMQEIASVSQVSRATLYRYFPSKKALAFGLLSWQTAEFVSPSYHAARQTFTGNGYEKFAQFLNQLLDSCCRFPDYYRFLGMVDFYYGDQESPAGLANLYQELFQDLLTGNSPDHYLAEGQHDGSVRLDLEPRLYTAMAIETIVSLGKQLALNRESTRLIYGLEQSDVLLKTAVEALLRASC